MKKSNLLILGLSILSLNVIGQKKNKGGDPFLKYEKVYYFDKNEEIGDYSIKLNNVIDYNSELKFAFKVENNSSDYILVQQNDSKITKVNKDFPVSEKTKLIAPQKSKSQTIRCSGGGANRAKEFTFAGNSVYSLKVNESAQKIEEVRIPLSRKDFSFNGVKCDIEVKEKSTQWTKIVTTFKNNSEDYLFVYPSRVTLRMPDENEYAPTKSEELVIIAPNETVKITNKWSRMPGGRKNDMQLVAFDMIFNEVFYFAKPKSLDGFSINVEWDEGLTDAKN